MSEKGTMKTKIIIAVTILLILLGTYWGVRRSANVEIIRPSIGPIKESVYAISSVKSDWNYVLKFGVITSVEKYFVKEGDEVKKGDNLLVTDSGTLFKSPGDGIVSEKPFEIKESITPQSTVLKIVDLKKLYIEATIEQMGALKILKNQNVIISFDDFRNQTFKGVVRSIFPRNQDFVIQIQPESLPSNILPGMTADLAIEIGTKLNATTLPTKSISNGYIQLRRSGKKEKIKVSIGINDSINVEILSPKLDLNDEILIPKSEIK